MASPAVTRSLLLYVYAVRLLAVAAATSPQSSAVGFLAPIPAPANSPCEDTAPDCMDVCGCDETGINLACKLSSPIGDYLRCVGCTSSCLNAMLAVHSLTNLRFECRANCKMTCGMCGSVAPSPSQAFHIPTPYGSSSTSYACTDITPPLSPYTCAQQVKCACRDIAPTNAGPLSRLFKQCVLATDCTVAMQKAFGKCTAAFITDAAPGLPLGYCQV